VLSTSAGAWSDWKDPNVAGAREHPLVKFYPQARVGDYARKDFDAVDMVTGYKKGAGEPVTNESIEGTVTRYRYEHKPQTSALEIVRNYENALKKQGFVTIVAGKETQNPGVPAGGGNAAFGAFRLDRDGAPAVWINVSAYEANGPDDPFSDVMIVEIKAMEQKLDGGAAALFDELQKSGRVAVYGITFDTGKSTIKAESDKVLSQVSTLLAQHPDLKLRIEGHTDNVGSAAANKKLSGDRANAVKNWLQQKGAKPSNLSAAGFGDAKPVAGNESDVGRAQNRRVELVRQ
jgi:outer membrane protein OmpA-like peptidoglycan-associated protein